MVDFTRIDKITRTKQTTKDVYYSDFLVNFNAHPETKVLAKAVNEDSIKKAVRNLILTNKGERLYQPDNGCDISNLLFEDMSEMTAEEIRIRISDAITKHEPRVRIIDIAVVPDEIRNSYYIGVYLEVINSVNPITVNLTLYRVR